MSLEDLLSIAGPNGAASIVIILIELCSSIAAGYPVLLPTSAGRDAWECLIVIGLIAGRFVGQKIRDQLAIRILLPALGRGSIVVVARTGRLIRKK